MPEYFPLSDETDVFAWLEHVREHQVSYASTLRELESIIFGYYVALECHGIVETVPSMGKHFRQWLHFRNDWSEASSWPAEFERRFDSVDEQFREFFRHVAIYSDLKPSAHCAAQLLERHSPTGNGPRHFNGGREVFPPRPDKIIIMQYSPDPLYFLRMHYGTTITYHTILEDTQAMTYATSLQYAKDRVAHEFGVPQSDWKPCDITNG